MSKIPKATQRAATISARAQAAGAMAAAEAKDALAEPLKRDCELRIKVPRAECANQVLSVALRLQLDEFGEVKFLKEGAVVPEVQPASDTVGMGYADWLGSDIVYDYQAHDDGLSDSELWTVNAEERRAWMTEATLLENNPDLSRPLVTPFTVAVPAVNYPPAVEHYRSVHGPVSRHSFNDLSYRYIAVVRFADGRTENVSAGHTTFSPFSQAAQPVLFTQSTILQEPGCGIDDFPSSRKYSEELKKCLPESQRSVFLAEIYLEEGNIVGKGQSLKGQVIVRTLKAGLTTMSQISVNLRTLKSDHWAQAQAVTGGDLDFFNATSGMCQQPYLHHALDGISRSRTEQLITLAHPYFDFELQIPYGTPVDFDSYYTSVQHRLELRLTVLYPPEVAKCIRPDSNMATEEEATGDDATNTEEGLWDSHTLVGKPVTSAAMWTRRINLQGAVAITVVPTRATTTPAHPVEHYLTPGVPAPVLRSGAKVEMPDAFPVMRPVFTVKALANTSARLMQPGSTDPSQRRQQFRNRTGFRQSPDPAEDYHRGQFAGLLWKKIVAEERGILPFGPQVVHEEDGSQRLFPVAL
ncbi:hypothetical protein K438DRAFT_1953758 [Mycena galopus ATCC 62051]|nr:hypothetical protein K438DRAFT_1953758 [Mycena galopus ATCC 62051]